MFFDAFEFGTCCEKCGCYFSDMGFERMEYDGVHCPRCGEEVPEEIRHKATCSYNSGVADRYAHYAD